MSFRKHIPAAPRAEIDFEIAHDRLNDAAAAQIFRVHGVSPRYRQRVGLHRMTPCADGGDVLRIAARKVRNGRRPEADDRLTRRRDITLKVAAQRTFPSRRRQRIMAARKMIEPNAQIAEII